MALLTAAQTSKSAESRVSKPVGRAFSSTLPTWKSAIQQVWKPALRAGTPRRRAGSAVPPQKALVRGSIEDILGVAFDR